MAAIRAESPGENDLRIQEQAGAKIPEMAKLFEQGRYVQAVSVGERLLGRGMLSEPQQIAVQQQLGFAYVALGEEQLAREAFGKAIALRPEVELPAITTSPKILKLYRVAKDAFLKERKEQERRAAAPVASPPDASLPSP